MNFQTIIVIIKRKPSISIALLGIVVILALIYLRHDKLGEHQAHVDALQSDLSKLKRNRANAAELEKQLSDLKQLNEEIQKRALVPSDLAGNSKHFYTMEADNNVKLLDFQQQPVRAAANAVYMPMNFSLSIEGEHENVLRFMRQVETIFVGGKVVSATMAPKSASTQQQAAKFRSLVMVVQTIATAK